MDYPPLTRWRRRLAELCYLRGLPFAVVDRHYPSQLRFYGSDLYSIAVLALCQAAQMYDPCRRDKCGRRTKFSTYAWSRIHGIVGCSFRNRQNRLLLCLTLDATEDDGAMMDDDALYANCRRNLLGDYDAVDARLDAAHYLGKFKKKRSAEMVMDRMEGVTFRDMAKRYGISQQRCRQVTLKAFRFLGIKPEREESEQ